MRAAVVALALLAGLAGPAAADEPPADPTPAPSLIVTADPATATVGQAVSVTLAGPMWVPVHVDVSEAGTPSALADVSTDGNGAATLTWRPKRTGTAILTATAGDLVATASVTVGQSDSVLQVAAGATKVRSESAVAVSAVLGLHTGVPWASGVQFEYKAWKQKWRTLAALPTAADGRSRTTDRPWKQTLYRVRFPGDEAARAAVSQAATVATRPGGRVVRRPRRYPEPIRKHRKPDRPAPVGHGANPRVRHIPDNVFRTMRGLSWQRGCLARSSLRLVSVNYWGFDGYRYRGQLVVNAAIASRVARIFGSIYRIRYPIRQMRLVDGFGRNRWKGANDYRSMAADNTSAFNCRYVVGREPHVLSPHASGRSIDINPWENPFLSARGVYPNKAYLNRSVKHPAVINANDRVRRIMARNGCSWLGYSDTQHFDCWGSPRRAAAASLHTTMPQKWQYRPGDKYGWGME